jgi:tetratricopeptide (TPR) repeat protein
MANQMSPLNSNPAFIHALSSHQDGLFDSAIEIYRQLNQVYSDNAQLLYLLGTAEYQAGNVQGSIKLLEQSLLLDKNRVEAMNNLGNALRDFSRFDEALQYFDQAISLAPNYADAHNNRGNVLRDLNLLEQALQSYDQAIALRPSYAQAHYNRGSVLHELNQPELAIKACDQAISLDERHADAYSVRGIAQYRLNQLESSLNSLDIALKLAPNHVDANFNKALVNLALGNFVDGWRLFEWRWNAPLAQKYRRSFSQQLWLGHTSLLNKSILIYAEQGLGDVIQFCRYIPMVRNLGANIIVQVPTALKPLIKSLNCECTILGTNEAPSGFDYHCPVMSLPFAFKTTLKTMPSTIPYLFPDSELRLLWKKQLTNTKQLRVGLVWSGSVTHKNDSNRSISLIKLASFFDLPIEFHSLQKVYREDDLLALQDFGIIDHHKELKDFSNTAALISELDLVISVDTSVAHLAGAVGKSTLLLLPFSADYRWMTERADSPWYPSMKLFRQNIAEDWQGVVSEVKNHLKLVMEEM